jgi:hypothetical protein
MPRVRFEPTIPASKRAKTVHALDHSATVPGRANHLRSKKKLEGSCHRLCGVLSQNLPGDVSKTTKLSVTMAGDPARFETCTP